MTFTDHQRQTHAPMRTTRFTKVQSNHLCVLRSHASFHLSVGPEHCDLPAIMSMNEESWV